MNPCETYQWRQPIIWRTTVVQIQVPVLVPVLVLVQAPTVAQRVLRNLLHLTIHQLMELNLLYHID